MFARKTIPARLQPAHDAFLAQAERVQAARRVLLSCLPVGRVDPAPVPVGLGVLDDELAEVAARLAEWRAPETEDAWRACRDAVVQARTAVPRARELAETSGELEELLGAVQEAVEPLAEAWGAAERRWRQLRVRPGRQG